MTHSVVILTLHRAVTPTLSRPITAALSAMAGAVGINAGVSFVKGMTVDAMSLCRLLGNLAISISGVRHSGGKVQVAGAATGSHFAEVVDFHVGWDNTVESEAVGIDGLGIANGSSPAIPEMPVALGVKGASPEPAVSKGWMQGWDWSVLINVLPKALCGRGSYVDTWHDSPPIPLYNTGVAYAK